MIVRLCEGRPQNARMPLHLLLRQIRRVGAGEVAAAVVVGVALAALLLEVVRWLQAP